MIAGRRMTASERMDVHALLAPTHPDEAALGRALTLFVEREDYGFVWMATDEADRIVGCVFVSYAISGASGGLLAHLDDLAFDVTDGFATGIALLETLAEHLRPMDITQMLAVAPRARDMTTFFDEAGFTDRAMDAHARLL